MEHPDIYGDPDKLRHLFLYLADNAVTYTQTDGQVDLTVREVEKLSNDYIVYQFIFRDTGIGISESSLQRIFDPFEREKNTTFSGIHGTGLGLTIARNIAEMMQGSIDVESTLGVGSTFTATLRLRIQNQTDPVFADSNEVLQRLFDQKILLVEDNEINLEIETEMLEELGVRPDPDGYPDAGHGRACGHKGDPQPGGSGAVSYTDHRADRRCL